MTHDDREIDARLPREMRGADAEVDAQPGVLRDHQGQQREERPTAMSAGAPP